MQSEARARVVGHDIAAERSRLFFAVVDWLRGRQLLTAMQDLHVQVPDNDGWPHVLLWLRLGWWRREQRRALLEQQLAAALERRVQVIAR